MSSPFGAGCVAAKGQYMAFGKDARLINEAVITGLKYDAKEHFWAALAHTNAIELLQPLALHWQIVNELRIDLSIPVVDKTKELEAYFKKYKVTFVTRPDEKYAQALDLKAPQCVPGSEHWRDTLSQMARSSVFQVIGNALFDMNMYPGELVAMGTPWSTMEKTRHSGTREVTGGDTAYGLAMYYSDLTRKELTRQIRQLIAQRRFFAELIETGSIVPKTS